MVPPALKSWTEPFAQPDVGYDKMVTGMHIFLAGAVRVERPCSKIDVWDGAARHQRRQRRQLFRGGLGLKRRRDGLGRRGNAALLHVVHHERRCHLSRIKLREFGLAILLFNRFGKVAPFQTLVYGGSHFRSCIICLN